MIRQIAVTLLILALAYPVIPAHAESALATWQTSILSGSEKLTFYSLMNSRPKGSDRHLQEFMVQDGLTHERNSGIQALETKFSASPLLGYDNNLNGGVPGTEFTIGDFTLQVEEDSVAKAGVTVGLNLSAYGLYSIAPKQTLKLRLGGSYEYSPSHDLGKSAIQGSACLQSHVAAWSWIEGCVGHRYSRRSTAIDESYGLVSATQMIRSSFGDHEFKATYERGFRKSYAKSKLSVGIMSAVPSLGAIYTGINWGERISGSHTTLRGVSLSLTRPIFGVATSISVNYQELGGGTHFGLKRADSIYSVSARRSLSKRFSASLGYQVSRSNIDLYDSGQVLFGLHFRPVKLFGQN